MSYISNRIVEMEESATLAMTRIAGELQAQGHDVIKLSIGEPDFDTPMIVKEAGKRAIDENYSHYSPVPGFMELRKAVSKKFKRDNNLDYSPEQIVVSTGAKQSIVNVMMSLVNPGDVVIVPSPFWVSYNVIVKLAGGVPEYIQTGIEDDFKLTSEMLDQRIKSLQSQGKTVKAVIYSSPCNPSGSVYTKDELFDIATVISKYDDIFILADEIYEHINFLGVHYSIAQFDFIKDRVITINGVSKGYAMTGWRIGYIGASIKIAKACTKFQGQITSGACSIAQRAVIEALEIDPEESEDLKNMLSAFRKRRDNTIALLKEIPGLKVNIPDGAFYIFPDVTEFYGKKIINNGYAEESKNFIKNGEDLCMYILEKYFVALVPGSAFGMNDCIRISYAAEMKSLEEAVRRIKEALANLK